MPAGSVDLTRVAAVRLEVRHRQRLDEAVDLDVHALQAPDHVVQLASGAALLEHEVVPQRRRRHLRHELVARVDDLVGLELARHALLVGLRPRRVPVGEDRLAVERALRERDPLRHVLLVRADGRRVRAALLVRHAGGDPRRGRHGVAVAHVEQVVDVAVEEVEALARELRGQRAAVEVVDPAHRLVGDLVVDRVRVGREEERGAAHLVRVDEQLRRQLAQQLDLAVGLGLRAREPVAVHVEAVVVPARVGLAAVRVLRGQQHDQRVVEDLRRRAVGPVGQLVERAQRGVGPALLAAVHVAGDPQDRRGRARQLGGRGGVRGRIAQLGDVRAHGLHAEPARVLGRAHDRVVERPALDRGRERARRDAVAGRINGCQVRVGLRRRHIVVAEREAQHRLRRRHLAPEDRCGRHRIAGRRTRGGRCQPGNRQTGRNRQRSASAPHRTLPCRGSASPGGRRSRTAPGWSDGFPTRAARIRNALPATAHGARWSPDPHTAAGARRPLLLGPGAARFPIRSPAAAVDSGT